MPIYLNREEEIKGKAPLEFYGDGQNLKDWEIWGKTSENLCERYTSVGTAQQYSASLYMFADIQPSTTYTIAFEIDEGSLQYFNENLFTYSQYYVTGTGNKQLLQLNAKANIQKTASTWSDTYGWIIAKNYTGNATVPHWKKIQLLKGTYTSSTIPPYEPYGGVGERTENLFGTNRSGTISTVSAICNGSEIAVQSDGTNILVSATAPVWKNISSINLSAGNYGYKIERTGTTTGIISSLYDANNTLVASSQVSGTFTLSEDKSIYIGFFIPANTTANGAIKLTIVESSTAPPSYIPYGYKIPVRVESENLFDGKLEQGGVTNSGGIVSSAVRVRGDANVKPLTAYTIASNKPFRMCYGYNYDGVNLEKVGLIFDNNSGNNKLSTFTTPEGCNYIRFALWNGDESNIIPTDIQNLILVEGTYTASTIPLYEVNLYTDNQLLDGDSISLSSTQLNIPTLNNYNILTVPTQVQPSNITLTLPQTETEITKILGPLISPRYDITDAYFGNLQVFTVWDTYTGQLPTTLYTTDWGLVDYKIYGTADGAGIKTENLYNYNASDAVSLTLYPSEENGRLLSGQNNVSIIFEVKPNTTYSIYKLSTTRFRWACYAAAPQAENEATSFSSSVSNTNTTLTFTTDSQAAYAVVFIRASNDSIDRDVLLRSVVVVEGSTAAQGVPYGYKIPMRSQNSVVDIYIGDTPLGENEYVSYSDQKIYKYINGVLTPIDPPKELPMITTINGNTTIDTTLEEKQYITSDNKVYCVKNGGRYLLKGSGLRPDNFYSKYRKGGT